MNEKNSPLPLRGLRHLALRVTDLAKSRAFYQGLLGMRVVWEPDDENLYLSSGADNLALHQAPAGSALKQGDGQFLDHFGFIAETEAGVDEIAAAMKNAGVPILKPVKRHRDGSYSFYMADPDGNVIQILYEPNVSPLP